VQSYQESWGSNKSKIAEMFQNLVGFGVASISSTLTSPKLPATFGHYSYSKLLYSFRHWLDPKLLKVLRS
jgi:hypothetical protein